jgi:hypothetical protein
VIWIILGVVIGTLVVGLAIIFSLYWFRRSKRRIRGFSLRSATPLDDAEFESWRRPGQYTQRPEKYGIRPTEPTVVRTKQPLTVRTTQPPSMFEKELGNYASPQIQTQTSSTLVQKPKRARRKSSCTSSIYDRPPTPYSPASPSKDHPLSPFGSPTSYGSSPRSIHYPAMSETSAFDFNLDSYPRDSSRPSSQSTRPLNLSYTSNSYYDTI